jgi:hypothetical protein
MRPARVQRAAVILRPSTLLHFHHALVKRKYRLLFSPKRGPRPGPKGPSKELIAAVETKRRNPSWGCPRIAQQISLAFGVDIDRDWYAAFWERITVRNRDPGGPSWLTFLGHTKDSLWSADLLVQIQAEGFLHNGPFHYSESVQQSKSRTTNDANTRMTRRGCIGVLCGFKARC